MQHQAHHKSLEHRSRQELHDVIRATFDALPLITVQQFQHPVGEWGLKVDAAANKFLDEFKLRNWIIEQNVLKGLAPPSSEVGTFHDVVAAAAHGPDVPLPSSRSDMSLAKNRHWMERYRGRWGITLGKVNSRGIVQPEEIREKVCVSCY